ncbi:hypothetical protein [Mucilaginibacter psychrotolerans]|uniref:Uncharacterized protein n=1 Tax=Mucilaginibacter psychrotolerans TaxID=1524096 RepID=A0A4Y8SQN1_9SPHI|nr:hypothetical protein [Mucilaginibacter psychrotolerans]TFF40734.1 hypothetical protein E2R66_00730 [Mucilaginibacter psychrotolerans]
MNIYYTSSRFQQCTVLICCFLLLTAFSVAHPTAASIPEPAIDSIRKESKVREVLLSQQLFMVKISPIKGKHPKNVDVNFKAELRDAFMIIRYEGDKSITEQEWRMCPAGKCPIATTYNFGTPGYKQLDTLMAQTKKSDEDSQRRMKALRKTIRKQKK